MAFGAKILADSLAPSGKRLTTFEATYPRCIHSEIMTHRILSKNAASSRAIPSEKLIARVMDDPFIPIEWGKNQKGMQAGEELSAADQERARMEWLESRNASVTHAKNLLALGLHKQIVNRIIEPWMWITIIVSGTEWSNFFGLRVHKDAEPHFQKIAGMMKALYEANAPNRLAAGDWHLPLIQPDEQIDDGNPCACDGALDNGCWRCSPERHQRPDGVLALDEARRIAVGRCARVSYLTHNGQRDTTEDVGLHDRLMNANPGHWTPFEHVARAESDSGLRSGNFFGWTQYRKLFEQEHIGGRMP